MLALGILGVWADTDPVASQDGDPDTRAKAYLRTNAHRLGLRSDLQDLELIAVREGLSGQHVRYQQTLGGVPVFGRFLTVSLPKERGLAAPPFVISRYRQGIRPVPGDNDGDTVPDPIETDDDNDGFSDTVELSVGTDDLDPCADTATANDESDDR